MRARKLVLNIAAFVACLAFVAGCGPSFKSGRDQAPNKTAQKPAMPAPETTGTSPDASSAPEQAPTDAPASVGVPGTETNGAQLIPISGEAIVLADKLVIGASLEVIGANNKFTAVLKNQTDDQKPNVEVEAQFSTTSLSGSVSSDKLVIAQIGDSAVNIDKSQYSVDYRCLTDCTTVEVNLQRVTGDKVGYRVSMQFEAKDKVYTFKKSSMTAQTLLSANAARELADPMVGVAPVDAVAQVAPISNPPAILASVPAAVVAPTTAAAPAAAATPSPEQKDENALRAQINALPNPTLHHDMRTCDKNSQAFKNEVVKFKKEVVLRRILDAERSGIRLTANQKADALALKPNAVIRANEPGFPATSRCNRPAQPTAAPKAKTTRLVQVQRRGFVP